MIEASRDVVRLGSWHDRPRYATQSHGTADLADGDAFVDT